MPKGKGLHGCPLAAHQHRNRPDIWVPHTDGKSSPLSPSLADWLTLRAPSAVFEGDRIDLTCQKKKDLWKVKTVAYYKDREELQLSDKVLNFSIQRAVLSDSGNYYCAVDATMLLLQKKDTSRSVTIKVQGKAFPPAGAGLDRRVADRAGRVSGDETCPPPPSTRCEQESCSSTASGETMSGRHVWSECLVCWGCFSAGTFHLTVILLSRAISTPCAQSQPLLAHRREPSDPDL